MNFKCDLQQTPSQNILKLYQEVSQEGPKDQPNDPFLNQSQIRFNKAHFLIQKNLLKQL